MTNEQAADIIANKARVLHTRVKQHGFMIDSGWSAKDALMLYECAYRLLRNHALGPEEFKTIRAYCPKVVAMFAGSGTKGSRS